MSSSSSKISVYSLADLKNTSDDALPNYLNSLKFRQSHTLTDVRLSLGYAAVAIAAATFYYDHKFGWEASKSLTVWAVLIYCALNTAFTGWIWLVEKGQVYQGQRDGVTITISSSVTKHTPIYKLTVQSSGQRTAANGVGTKQIQAPFTQWFTADGQFVAKPFQEWLASEVPTIREAANSKPTTNRPKAA